MLSVSSRASEEYTMSDEEYDGPVIELVISMSYDAKSYRSWVKVPSDWDSRTSEAKEIFLQEEAEAFLVANIETDAIVHNSVAEAVETSSDYWGGQFSPDQLEDIYE
jgi:hypothetical protein